ncbi:MAG: hypothetical protein U9R38_01535 [Candidatus Margulisiibacteriota bacterium]|nr:hypothetical protein [Candidatus Margulisiibacteriota bacterium]
MKNSLKEITLKNLAAFVSKQLKKHKIDVVLTGGACVSIFSNNKYQSLDLDFVSAAVEYKPKAIIKAMREIGFERAAEGFFAHSNCPYIIEFIQPPLSIGREPVKKIKNMKTKYGTIKLLNPTDCVKDRLAAYYFWDDLQSLEQAKMVTQKQKVDLKEVKRWSRVEGELKKYSQFIKQLEKEI